MNTPPATYRIPLSPALGFQAANAVISYLADLGISDMYASPIFKAVQGSLHDYDVFDPSRLNLDLGGLSDFEAPADELRKHNMGWIQDIVPNPMAMDSENRLLMDILENGYRSKYLTFFDVDWDHPDAPASTRESWRRFLAGSMGSASKTARSHSNAVLTASRLLTATSPSL